MEMHSKNLKYVAAESGCWIFNGKTSPGYGYLRINGKMTLAHRVSYEQSIGPIASHLYVCHRCNEKRCINPDHLYLATPSQNQIDAHNDGLYRVRGFSNPKKRPLSKFGHYLLKNSVPIPVFAAEMELPHASALYPYVYGKGAPNERNLQKIMQLTDGIISSRSDFVALSKIVTR